LVDVPPRQPLSYFTAKLGPACSYILLLYCSVTWTSPSARYIGAYEKLASAIRKLSELFHSETRACSYILFIYCSGTWTSPSARYIGAYEKLASAIRKLSGLPLSVSSVQPVGAVFANCEEFPPGVDEAAAAALGAGIYIYVYIYI